MLYNSGVYVDGQLVPDGLDGHHSPHEQHTQDPFGLERLAVGEWLVVPCTMRARMRLRWRIRKHVHGELSPTDGRLFDIEDDEDGLRVVRVG